MCVYSCIYFSTFLSFVEDVVSNLFQIILPARAKFEKDQHTQCVQNFKYFRRSFHWQFSMF